MRFLRYFLIATGFAAGLFFAAAPAAGARTLNLADLRHELTLADPQISPDGSRVALLTARQDFDHNTLPIRVLMIEVTTGAIREVPAPGTDITFVRWSPPGDRIAFLASVSGGSKQLYVASPSGGDRRKLTNAPFGVNYFVWTPDGQAIAYAALDQAPQRHGSDRFNVGFEVGDNDYLTTAHPLPAHLWLVSASGGVPKQLTTGASIVPVGTLELTQPYLDALTTPQHFPDQFFCWTDGSRSIAYTKVPDPYLTHWDRAVMVVRDLATGREHPLTGHGSFEAGCDSTPDGAQIAYWYPHGGKPLAASDIFVASAESRDGGSDATRNLDRAVWVVRWMPDGKSLLVLAHDRTREDMWVVSTQGAVRRLEIGDLSASAASVSRDGTIAFVASSPKRPSEVFVMRPRGSPRRLTDLNGYFAGLRLGDVGHVGWTNDGFEEDGVLTYPPDFVAGKKYPLVLQIHGWPQYASQEAFDTDYPGLTQLFAAHGYVVFEPNYRGSDNMGSAFEAAIAGDTVEGPGRDIMAGIAAVEKLGIVDESRIAVTGWSYGGLLTAWLIGRHSFKAAMAGGAPTDEPVDYAINNYSVLERYWYGGTLWSSQAIHQRYVEQSPITYAWNITTPTLIMSSVYDATVPVTHAYELFHALRERGVPTQFIAYPTSDHFPSDPVSSEDVYRRWVGWLDRYLR